MANIWTITQKRLLKKRLIKSSDLYCSDLVADTNEKNSGKSIEHMHLIRNISQKEGGV